MRRPSPASRTRRASRKHIDYLDQNDYIASVSEERHCWTVASAKARLSEVIDRARTQGPQTITRNGKEAAIVVDAAEWKRRTRRQGSLSEFFAASPLVGSGVVIERPRDVPEDGDP